MNRALGVSVIVLALFFAHTGGHLAPRGEPQASAGSGSWPHLRSSAPATCSATFSSLSSAIAAMSSARASATECLASGSYGAVNIGLKKSVDVMLAAAPGAHVSVGPVSLNGSHIGITGLWVKGEIDVRAGTSFVTISHNDITGGYFGIVFDTADCTAPNAPTWPGCKPQPKITDVTIARNHFHDIGKASGGEDAIHLDNWARIEIIYNEFNQIVESGNHTDCLQSVYGGDQLLFSYNYEHDNNCQGFFIKDGDSSHVSFRDNLFLRDSIGASANFAQVWNTAGLGAEHNTIWDDKGLALVADGSVVTPTAAIDHNVLAEASVNHTSGKPYALFHRAFSIFGDAGSNFPMVSTDRVLTSPHFINPATDDYRLATNPNGIGIDWRPADQQYGPAH